MVDIMPQMNMLDIGKAYGDAERVKGMRTQNAMAEYTMETSKEDRLSAKDEANRLWTAKSLDWLLGQDEAERPRLYQDLRKEAIGRGMDPSQISETYSRENAERSVAIAKGFGKPGADFTLSPDQARYGPGGNEIASRPGKPVAPKPFTLGQGQRRFGPDGKEIANVPAAKTGPLVTVNTGDQQAGPMTPAQAGARTRDSLDKEEKATTNVAEIEDTLDDLNSIDFATGIPGYLIDNLGGIIAQAPFVGSALAEKMGTEKVAAVRSKMQRLIAQMVSTYSGEESGRVTKEELGISQQASKAKDPKADMTQIVGALNSIREIELRVIARESMKRDNIPDLTSSIGRSKYVDDLKALYPNESDDKLVDRLIETMQKYRIHRNYKKYDPR